MRHASIDTTLRSYVGKNADAAAAVWQSVGGPIGNTPGNSRAKAMNDDGWAVVAKGGERDT
jgi:hypothetical protein